MRTPVVGEVWRTKSCKTQWKIEAITGEVVTLRNPAPGPSSVDYIVRFLADLRARFEPVPTQSRWLDPESVGCGAGVVPCSYRGCPYPKMVAIATQRLCPYCAATTGTPSVAARFRLSVLSPAPKWPQGQTPVIRWYLLEKFAPLHALRKNSTQTAAMFVARVICSDEGTPRWTRA